MLPLGSWTYIQAHGWDRVFKVPGEIKRSRDQEEEGGDGPSSQPRRDHELGGGAALRKLDFFRFGLFLNSSATDIVLVILPSMAVEAAIAQCTSRWAMARGHRLNRHFHCSGGGPRSLRSFSGGIRGRAFTLSSPPPPPPPPSPSLISHLASVDVNQNVLDRVCEPVWPSGKALGW